MDDAVGVIGLGNMGSAFSANLLRNGFDVVGFDPNPSRAAALDDAGGRALESAAAVAGAAAIVITSLPSAASLAEVTDQLAGSDPHPEAVLVEMGTLGLDAKRATAGRLEGRFTVLDAPVSGTGTQAKVGDIAVYASGDRAGFDRALPALQAFSRTQHYLGEFGTGIRMKYVANLLVTIHNVAAAEALTLARRAGLDLHLVLDVIAQGAGTSRMFEVRGPVMAAQSFDESTANIEIYKKDLALINGFAADMDCPVPLLALSSQLYAAAMAQGRSKQDGAAVAGVLGELAGLPAGSGGRP